jgi:hypothetical protein
MRPTLSKRRFHHSFAPSGQGTSDLSEIELTTTEIADAAVYEIVQTALTAAPFFDLFLDQLLAPESQWFRWVSPLGEIRETRTALSGLFGRFVARAYLTRYCQFDYFEPIRSDMGRLKGWPNFSIRRNFLGDLPDWIVASASGANSLAIAEAKGSHNAAGAGPSLKQAREQVKRIDIISGSVALKVKRYALATRWAVERNPKLDEPWLTVHDPEQGEREPNSDERAWLVRSVGLGHYATIAEGFGLPKVASALREAKLSQPGGLSIPTDEVTIIEQVDGPLLAAIGAIVTPMGVVVFPRNGELEEFRSALRTVFGDRCVLLAVDVANLQALDSGPLPDRALAPPTTTRRAREVPFWSGPRHYSDGSRFIPLNSITLRRQRLGQPDL